MHENRGLYIIFVTGFLLSGSMAAAEVQTPATSDEAAVLAVEDEWIAAEINHDEATLRRVLHDGFLFNSNAGHTSDKDTMIAGVLSWNMTGQTISERSVLVNGDTAMIFGTTELRFFSEDNGETKSLLRYTTTWLKRAGHWRAIALHMAKRTSG